MLSFYRLKYKEAYGRLMVANEYRRSYTKMFLVLDLELKTCREPHGPFEAAPSGPLTETTVAHASQNGRCSHSIQCADE